MDKVYRAMQLLIFVLIVMAINCAYQWGQDIPDWEAAIEHGYFQGLAVPVSYWWFKAIGWLQD